MSIALVGLVSFQFYWINNAIKLNNERFANDVRESLIRVARNMEKQEILAFTAQNLFMSDDSALLHEDIEVYDDDSKDSKKLIFVRPDNPRPHKLSKYNLKLVMESAKWKGQTDSSRGHFSFERRIKDSIVVVDTLIYGRIRERKKMIDVVFNEILDYSLKHDRIIDTLLLDSLLSDEFMNKGIDINYQYAVWDAKGDSLVTANSVDTFSSDKAEYKASLFPNDLLGNTSYLLVNFPSKNQFLFKQIWITLASSFLLLVIILFCFSYAILTIIRQKKLSEIKNDFINNMTHELKTPIATVSLACEALGEDEINTNKATFNKYLGIIQEENKRLSGHVEKVLQLAITDREGIKLNFEKIDLNSLASTSINNISLQVSQKKGIIETEMKAENSTGYIDRHHMLNVINNILDNALKYSGMSPKIRVSTQNQNGILKLSIRDNGIGLSGDQTKKIFEKFYRVPTGNVHDVKGFGLGLSYAKNIVDAHSGKLTVKSELGQGSEFVIELPVI